MKREIKFRGKRIDNGEWIYGTFMVIRNVFDDEDPEEKTMFFDSKWVSGGEYIGECWIEVDPETVGQYTGLKDKNGVEIYEGDWLNSELDKPMVVGWSNRFASFVLNRKGWAFAHWFGESCEPEHIEVIGNIHDKPEMK